MQSQRVDGVMSKLGHDESEDADSGLVNDKDSGLRL
jgi:hypothetical protein